MQINIAGRRKMAKSKNFTGKESKQNSANINTASIYADYSSVCNKSTLIKKS